MDITFTKEQALRLKDVLTNAAALIVDMRAERIELEHRLDKAMKALIDISTGAVVNPVAFAKRSLDTLVTKEV
jgi:hypothetical protein